MKPFVFFLSLCLFLPPFYAWSRDDANYSRKGSQVTATKPLSLPSPGKKLLNSPGDLKVVELPSQALPLWRPFREERPTLALLSSDPFLMGIPEELAPQVVALVVRGGPEDFRARAKRQVAAPLLLPQQTLSAALNSNFFSKILWVLPPVEKGKEISLEIFRRQLTEAGTMSKKEADGLVLEQGVFRGTLRGVPFQAARVGALPQLAGPVVLHLDLSFFTSQYRNELTTPLFSLLHSTLLALRQTAWPVVLACLSVSTEEGEVPLEMRFLKDALTEAFARPGKLDAPLSEAWALRKEARYLETFFQPEAIIENFLRMETLLPKEASVKYDIYRALMSLKEEEEAFGYLIKAVQLDNGYGREYVDLAMAAAEKGRLKEALGQLKKGQKALPLNPFITIETVNVLLELGERQQARALLAELEKLPWSALYYPEFPEIISALSRRAKAQK